MKRPLRLILIICLIAAILLQINLFTGAATTQSTVTILAQPPIPPTPGPTPGPAPSAEVAVPMPPEMPEIFYIGDFAVHRIYEVLMGLDETWIYTYKNVNYTITPIRIDAGYAEFAMSFSKTHAIVALNQTTQIDSDSNGYSDIIITFNSIKNGKADVTLELPVEIYYTEITMLPQLYYLILILLALLIIDTIIHHKKAKNIFKHSGKLGFGF